MTENPTKFPPDEYSLLTVIVNASHAVFYRNTAVVGTVVMPRYVCHVHVYVYVNVYVYAHVCI